MTQNKNEWGDKEGDIELVKKAQAGDREAEEILIKKYEWVVRSHARRFFLKDGSMEDLLQEGMIGVWKAIARYDYAKNDNFVAFIHMCVVSAMKDAVRMSNRDKNRALNDSVGVLPDGTDIGDVLTGLDDDDPEENSEKEEATKEFQDKLKEYFNEQQLVVLKYYLEGYTYGEIASMIGVTNKKVDNILFGIKKKIKKYYKEIFEE